MKDMFWHCDGHCSHLNIITLIFINVHKLFQVYYAQLETLHVYAYIFNVIILSILICDQTSPKIFQITKAT